MRRLFLLPLILLVFSACTEDAPPVATDGPVVMADMQYFPTTQGSAWEYRIDTSGAGGGAKGVAQLRSAVTGEFVTGALTYALQVNEIITPGGVEYDTMYVRKASDGVYISSPGLQQLSGLTLIPGFPIEDLPKEFLAVPYGNFQGTWEILNIEIDLIPILPIYFRVNGRYIGQESVQTDQGGFENCARVRISIEAQLPNPENPTDIFNPLRINESADFWYTRPQGLVVADGSNAVFIMLRGGLPIARSFSRTRQEVISMSIPQPVPFCLN